MRLEKSERRIVRKPKTRVAFKRFFRGHAPRKNTLKAKNGVALGATPFFKTGVILTGATHPTAASGGEREEALAQRRPCRKAF